MRPIKVLLATMPPLVSGLLARVIQDQGDMEVVHSVGGDLDLLLAVKLSHADVVILWLQQSVEVPGICTHLLTEHPNLLILALPVSGSEGVIYRQAITATQLPLTPTDNLLRAIRSVDDA